MSLQSTRQTRLEKPNSSAYKSNRNTGQYDLNYGGNDRFCYRIWGRHQVLSNIVNYQSLFDSILQETKIQKIILNFEKVLPAHYRGACIQLYAEKQNRLFHACKLLLQHLQQVQKIISIPSIVSLSIVVPRMLVPVLMGKQGKFINKIKKATNTSVVVHGPYSNCICQNIEITSFQINDVAKCCYIVYNTVYKALKLEPVVIDRRFSQRSSFQIGIAFRKDIQQNIFGGYSKYIANLQYVLQIWVQKEQESQIDARSEVIYHIQGQFESQVTINQAAILQIIEFESSLGQLLKLIITTTQAKIITSHNGKFLRDISSKCKDCFIEILGKTSQQGKSKVIIKGSSEGFIRTVRMVIQFLCFSSFIVEKERYVRPINYQKDLDELLLQFQDCQQGNQSSLTNQNKTKKIKKRKKNRKWEANRVVHLVSQDQNNQNAKAY